MGGNALPGGPPPAASATDTPSGVFGRRKTVCFLLGRGLRVRQLRCTLCDTELGSPRREGQRFEVGVPAAEPKSGRLSRTDGRRLLIGARVLVTGVNLHLISLLEASTNFLGEKVLAAMPPRRRMKKGHPYLFCVPCGLSLLTRLNPGNERRYSWDWLAEMEPRGLFGRFRAALGALGRRDRRETRSILGQWIAWRPSTIPYRPRSIGVLQTSPAAASRAQNRSA